MGIERELLAKALLESHIDLDILRPLLMLRIHGVEVTQAVQYYRADEHLNSTAPRGPDNSVRLAAKKPAWVRVYVRSYFSATSGVTGRLKIYRRRYGALWHEQGVLTPEPPGSVTAPTSADYAAERGDVGSTLNFIVPASMMCGNLRFAVEIESGGRKASKTIDVNATLLQTLRMRIVPVSYNGPNASGTGTLSLTAPDLADAQATAAWSLLAYPVQSTPDITLTSAVNMTFPLTGSPANPGGCAQSWIDLNVLVSQAKTADGNQPNTFYYGLVASGVPLGANSGCASSGVTSGMQGGQTTMAHEFGHALGYPHAPCGNVGGGDPNYPSYSPYPSASIGEYGLDIDTGDVKPPVTAKDYMSYCGPRWISLFNYQRAVDHAMLSPTSCGADRPWHWDHLLVDDLFYRRWPLPDPPPEPPWWWNEVVTPMDPREKVISIIGVRHLTGKIEVRSITRTLAGSEVQGGARTSIVAELVDEKGQSMEAGAVFRMPSQGMGCGCGESDEEKEGTWAFQAFVPDTGRGGALRLLSDGEEVWRREAPENKPSPAEVNAQPDKSGALVLSWKVSRHDEDCEVWIRAHVGRGRKMRTKVLHIARGSGRAKLKTPDLPSGKVRIDAVCHDGFDAVTGKAVTIDLPERPPTVAILHPYDKRTLKAGGSMRLHGMATAADGRAIDPEKCVWTIDGKQVGTGLDLFVPAPDPGEHEATLMAADEGGETAKTVRFDTAAPGKKPKGRRKR